MDNDEYKGTDFTRYVKPQTETIYSSAGTVPESPIPSITKPDTKHDVEQRKPTCIYFGSDYTQLSFQFVKSLVLVLFIARFQINKAMCLKITCLIQSDNV